MSETLEQIIERIAEEEFDSPEKNNFRRAARRLVAALGAQEPVAIFNGFYEVLPMFSEFPNKMDIGTKLYAAPVVKEGWQMVPKEPTEAMLLAMIDGAYSIEREQDEPRLTVYDAIRLEYKAMLAAAPEYKP